MRHNGAPASHLPPLMHNNRAVPSPSSWHPRGKFRPKGKDWDWYGVGGTEEPNAPPHMLYQRDHRPYSGQSGPGRYRNWDAYNEDREHPQGESSREKARGEVRSGLHSLFS